MTESAADRLRTPLGWKLAGLLALVPGLFVLTLGDMRAGGWKIPIRQAFRGAWQDWYDAFFADPEKPFLRTPRKPSRSTSGFYRIP